MKEEERKCGCCCLSYVLGDVGTTPASPKLVAPARVKDFPSGRTGSSLIIIIYLRVPAVRGEQYRRTRTEAILVLSRVVIIIISR